MRVAAGISKEGREAAIRRFVATYNPFSYYATLTPDRLGTVREALLADLAAGTATALPLLQEARDNYVVTPVSQPSSDDLQRMLAEGEAILVATFPELRRLVTGQD